MYRCVWSRKIVIGYNIANMACGQVNEELLTTFGVSCMSELAEIFGNIFVLTDYRVHITMKCHIPLAK